MIADRHLRGIGWVVLLAVAGALLFALSLRVNALKSRVRQAERQLVVLRHETVYLETEFETRANQQQLERWNDVEFGYVAPGPGQYFESAAELAALGRQAVPPASEPVRLAAAGPAEMAPAPARLPLAGTPPRAAAAVAKDRPTDQPTQRADRSAPHAKAAAPDQPAKPAARTKPAAKAKPAERPAERERRDEQLARAKPAAPAKPAAKAKPAESAAANRERRVEQLARATPARGLAAKEGGR